jgi:hypothetical protein
MAAKVDIPPTMTADYRSPVYQVPARKPLGQTHAGFQFQPTDISTTLSSPSPQNFNPPPPSDPSTSANAVNITSHQRNRTTSSSALPYVPSTTKSQQPLSSTQGPVLTAQMATAAAQQLPVRRLSNATSSTSSTGNHYPATYTVMSTTSDVQRRSSSRSATTQLGYVALMRRQKGTVWCDRAQPEDPRVQAQKRMAKQRAYMELHGGAGSNSLRTNTLASGKIRHSGKSGAPASYSPSTLVGATVPLRLSANEIGDEDDDHSSEGGMYHHRRSNSNRSSLGSMTHYPSGYQRPQGKTPPNEHEDIPEVVETAPHAEEVASDSSREDNSSAEQDLDREQDFGGVGDMSAPSAVDAALQKAKKADELRRRGSVDERTTSMTGVRLFVANPDLSD